MEFDARIQPNVGLGRTERIELSNYDLQRAFDRTRPAPAHHGGGAIHLGVFGLKAIGLAVLILIMSPTWVPTFIHYLLDPKAMEHDRIVQEQTYQAELAQLNAAGDHEPTSALQPVEVRRAELVKLPHHP